MSASVPPRHRALPYILPLQLFWLLTLPAIPLLLTQLMHTQRWYPACPDFLRALIWNIWFLCPVCLLLIRARTTRGIKIIWSAVAALNTLVCVPVALVSWGHLYLFKCPVSFLSIQAVLQTDAGETENFVIAYFSPALAAGMAAFLLVYLLFAYIFYRKLPFSARRTLPPRQTTWLSAVLLIFFFIIVPWKVMEDNAYGVSLRQTSAKETEELGEILEAIRNNDFDMKRNSLLRSHYMLRAGIEFAKAYENDAASRERARYGALPVDFGGCALLDASARRTYILILGEGASRTHMSLYGYPRPTSLALDELKGELLVYDQIISMFGITSPSLNSSFIFHDIQKGQQGIASILTLHREAGFKVYWLTNNLAGKVGEGPAWFNVSADVVINKNISTSMAQLSTYDEALLPELEKILAEDTADKFVVVHLAGLHPTFAYRYPPEAAVYADDDKADLYNADILEAGRIEKINTYDNAMIYNNKNVRAIIDLAAAAPGSSYVLYLSDHSQNLGEIPDAFQGYVASGGTQYMYNIPFIVWLSPEYKQANAAFCAHLPSCVGRFGKMDDTLAYSVAELSRISFGRFQAEKSLFSQSYVTPDTKIGDDFDYLKLPGGFVVK